MENNVERPEAIIKVFGIGGGGSNAVNRMTAEGMQGVEFYVANTDIQALKNSPVKNKIILGRETTGGLGAGANPEIGRKAAEESEADIREALLGADMVFIAAGLGGGTGTGAAPFFAKIAQELGILTVAIVTKPFRFERPKRMKDAESGLEELSRYVDSLIVISNNNLLNVIGNKPISESFIACDNILRQGVQTITDLIAVPAMINLDFADVKTTMEKKGKALIGIGMSDGENKAVEAAQKAIMSPLLDANISGAKSAIINVTGGPGLTLFDAEAASDTIVDGAGGEIDVIYGLAINENLNDEVIVTVIATGFEEEAKTNNIMKQFNDNEDNTVKEINIMTSANHQSTTPVNEISKPKVNIEELQDDDNGVPNFFKRF